MAFSCYVWLWCCFLYPLTSKMSWDHLALTVLKHLQGLLYLCFVITKLTQMVAGYQVFKDLLIKKEQVVLRMTRSALMKQINMHFHVQHIVLTPTYLGVMSAC